MFRRGVRSKFEDGWVALLHFQGVYLIIVLPASSFFYCGYLL